VLLVASLERCITTISAILICADNIGERICSFMQTLRVNLFPNAVCNMLDANFEAI